MLRIITLLASCVFLCSSSAFAAQTLRIGGGAAPMENIFKRIAEPFEKKTGIKLELIECGPVEAWDGLVNGRLDVASAGVGSLLKWRDMIAQTRPNPEPPKLKLSWHLIGSDVVTVYTNQNIRIQSLEPEQVADIFSGQITNWRDVGGPDHKITVILGNKVSGLMADFKKAILGDRDYAQRAVYVDTAAQMRQKVIATPGAVTIGTLAQVAEYGVNAISYPAPRRQISMIWNAETEATPAVKQLYDFIKSSEGQKFVLKGLNK